MGADATKLKDRQDFGTDEFVVWNLGFFIFSKACAKRPYWNSMSSRNTVVQIGDHFQNSFRNSPTPSLFTIEKR